MKKQIGLITAGFVVCLSCAFVADAQIARGGAFTLEQSVIAGGGGTMSASGTFEVSDTIAQHIAATSRGGDFTLDGGFWFHGDMIMTPVCAVDVTDRLSVTRGSFRQNFITRRFTQTITIQNSGASPVQGELVFVLDNLSSAAALFNPTGATLCAAPLDSPFASVHIGDDSVLTPGESVTLTLEFTNSNPRQSIAYTPRLLSGNNAR
ncbi:MAG: hypothetical protein ACRD9R_15540 [Pyrinomonadaceae bacterium]